MTTRRGFIKTSTGGLLVAAGTPLLSPFLSRAAAADVSFGPPELPDGTLAASTLEALPGKLPLIKKSFRPPNFETPVQYFRSALTQNKAFFVRWHLAAIPEVAAATTARGGTERVTKEPGEMTASSPMVILPTMIDCAPMCTRSPIVG